MGLFSKKKQIVSDEYEYLSSRLIEMKTELTLLKKDMDVMKTNMHSLRGLVNRKMGELENDEKAEEEELISPATLQRRLMGYPD